MAYQLLMNYLRPKFDSFLSACNHNCSIAFFLYLSIAHAYMISNISHPVGWGWRIRRLNLSRRVRPTNEKPGYGTELSDGEVQFQEL